MSVYVLHTLFSDSTVDYYARCLHWYYALLKHTSHVYVCVLNRGKQKDYRWDNKQGSDVYCWFVHNSGKGFIDGHYTSYIVPTLDSFLPLSECVR